MPSLPPVLKSNLPHVSTDRGYRWHAAHPWTDHGLPAAWTRSIEDPSSIPPADLLKTAPRRLVFRHSAYVIKAFPLAGWRRWFGGHVYARSECLHLLEARRRGLAVPACHAYGEAPRLGGLRWNAAVLEYLPGATLRDIWLSHPGPLNISRTLNQLTSLAGTLYLQGINHIDFGPHAVLLVEDRPHVIDWQYATFLDRPHPGVFASQIGYFAWSTATNRAWAHPDAFREWFHHLWDTFSIPHRSASLAIFESALARRHSISQRLQAQQTFARLP